MKALSVSTQRRAGGGTNRFHQHALLPRDGNCLRGGNLLHGHRHQVGMIDDFSFDPSVKVFRLQAMAIPLQATGGVKHYTKRTRTSHSRTRVFSRVAQDLSHRVHRSR